MLDLPVHIIYDVLYRLDLQSICQIRLTPLNDFVNEYFWEKKCAGANIEQNFYDQTYAWLYSAYKHRINYNIELSKGPWDPLCQFQKEYYGMYNKTDSISGEGRISYKYDEDPDLIIRQHVASDLSSLRNWDPDHLNHTLVKMDTTGHYSYKRVNTTTYFLRYTPFGAITSRIFR